MFQWVDERLTKKLLTLHDAQTMSSEKRFRHVLCRQPRAGYKSKAIVRSEITESMLILESLSITHQRLRVSLSVSLFLYLSFSLLGICCVRILWSSECCVLGI